MRVAFKTPMKVIQVDIRRFSANKKPEVEKIRQFKRRRVLFHDDFFLFQVSFAVQIHRVDVADAPFVGGVEKHDVGGDDVVDIETDDVASAEVFVRAL